MTIWPLSLSPEIKGERVIAFLHGLLQAEVAGDEYLCGMRLFKVGGGTTPMRSLSSALRSYILRCQRLSCNGDDVVADNRTVIGLVRFPSALADASVVPN